MREIKEIRGLEDLSLVDIAGSGWAAANLKDMDVYYEETYEQLFLMIKPGLLLSLIFFAINYLLNTMESPVFLKKHISSFSADGQLVKRINHVTDYGFYGCFSAWHNRKRF